MKGTNVRYADRAERIPHHCAFYPQIGPAHDLGFIVSDSLVDNFFGTHVSVAALRDIANKFPQVGLVPRDELTLAHAERDALRAEIEDIRAQMAEYDKELDAISVLKGRGYQPQKRTGRPPTKAKAA